MEKRIYTYRAYGLCFGSTFPLPELGEEVVGKPDISVDYGDVPKELESPSAYGIAWQASPGMALLSVSEVARYLVLKDQRVLIEPLAGSTESEVRIFLFGSVLGAILHARQMLVLHSSVIQTKKGAVLFMGNSGAGKSTLAAAFLKRGYSILSDDKAGIILDDSGVAQVMPGFPTIRLTSETVNMLGFSVNEAELSPGIGKFVLPVEQFGNEPITIYAAYAIAAHNEDEILLKDLDQLEQFAALNRYTYRRKFLHDAGRKQEHFRVLGAVADQIKVRGLLRPMNSSRIDDLVSSIEEDL